MPTKKTRKPQKPTPRQIALKKDAMRRGRKTKKRIVAMVKDGRFSDREKNLTAELIALEVLAAQGITKFAISDL